MENRNLSAKELSQMMGLSRPTLSRLVAAKKLGCYRIGARILFDYQRHVLPFLRSNEQKTEPLPMKS